MLVDAEDTNPQSITFNIDIRGWHRVFVGMLNLRTENYTYLKLSRDLCYSGIRHARQGSPVGWGSELPIFDERLHGVWCRVEHTRMVLYNSYR